MMGSLDARRTAVVRRHDGTGRAPTARLFGADYTGCTRAAHRTANTGVNPAGALNASTEHAGVSLFADRQQRSAGNCFLTSPVGVPLNPVWFAAGNVELRATPHARVRHPTPALTFAPALYP